MRHAKRAMSIDNISYISCTVEEKSKDTLNGNGNNGIEEPTNHKDNVKHASTDNLNKQSDDEQENIIPWRAHLRKTNSRLSLVG